MRASSIAKVLVCLVFVVSAAGRLGAQAAPANETATQFYTRYLAAFQKATKMEQVLPFMSATRVKEYNEFSAEQKSGMLEMVKMMAPQPDMVLEAAHLVAADFRSRGVEAPAVYVDAFASLNGRPMQRLIDPHVDLARQTDSLANKPWILPMNGSQESQTTLARSYP